MFRPLYFSLVTLGLKSLKDVENWIDNAAKSTDFGTVPFHLPTLHIYHLLFLSQNPEGFVLCKDAVPVAKMKNNFYYDVHSILTGDILKVRNIAISHFFAGQTDDTFHYFSPPLQLYLSSSLSLPPYLSCSHVRFIKELKQKVDALTLEAKGVYEDLLRKYREAVTRCPSRTPSYFPLFSLNTYSLIVRPKI